jgi:CHAT domain-containing protein
MTEVPPSPQTQGEAVTLLKNLNSQQDFLFQVLRVIHDSNKNPKVVYPLLQENLDKLDQDFIIFLQSWAITTLPYMAPELAQVIAKDIFHFSSLIGRFRLGSITSNQEIALVGYEVAATVYKREAFLTDWARTQNNLGLAYSYRIKGDKAENKEAAISYHIQALEVYTREVFPTDWAKTQNYLGLAYSYRIKGDEAENKEVAISYHTQTLEVYTRQVFPTDWAKSQNYLGNAYLFRIKGDKDENLEVAIGYYTQALQVRTLEAFSTDWAATQHNLGIAYYKRVKGDKAENLEAAICCFQAALQVRTRQAFPIDWAKTQDNLGLAYDYRIKGDKAENLEAAIYYYTQALQVYTRDAFPTDWARIQNNLGGAYSDRIKGDKAENLEVAIAYYEQVLQVYTRAAFRTDWARTQNNLGLAYSNRIKGDKAENLEVAIAYYNQALQVYTREAFPTGWASTQNNLGGAYSNRIKGDKAENLEVAIGYYTQALQVSTRAAFPTNWAANQLNLGNVYRERIRGDRAENLESAIRYYAQALQVYTREAFPTNWALTQNNLGLAYSDRIKGDKAENLESAIRYYAQALQVYTREAFPTYWALTQNNLANASSDRIKGDKAENLEAAIRYYNQALLVHTREAFPTYWALTQNNLANAYRDRIKGDKALNLEAAIDYYTQALQVYTREAFPTNWAIIQDNLGLAYTKRIKGGKALNLEAAIDYYTQALQVYTREAFPTNWAIIQDNLGLAYTKRIKGGKAENLEAAINYCQNALEIRTCDALPRDHAETLFNLGLAYRHQNQLPLAYSTFATAIETVETLRGEIVSGDEVKQKLAEEWNKLYTQMVEVCLKLGNSIQAIEYAERSKTRNLVELILSRDQNNIFPPEITSLLQQLRDEIAIDQQQIQKAKADNPTALERNLQKLRQQRNELQNRYLRVGYGFKFDQFQATLDEHTAIIEWYITEDKILTFIIKPKRKTGQKGEVNVWQSTVNDRNALSDWMDAYQKDYDQQKDNWRTQLTARLEELAKILHLNEIIWKLPPQCDRLILIPHRELHLFPLHALPLSYNNETVCLLDLFPQGVSYAPSCQLLQLAQKRLRPNFTQLFAVQNPTGDLTYTDLEVQAITGNFQQANVLEKAEATLGAINKASLNTVHCAHFSCHGYFNLTNPRKSALILANAPVASVPANPDAERYLNLRDSEVHDLENCLTLDNIFSLDLEQCRLVTLSACETGLIDFKNTSDEYIGLPSGFLLAGSPNVVSSLWNVKDDSTSFLMIKFYQNLKAGLTVTVALNQAQIWLRDATTAELQEWASQLTLADELAQKIKKAMRWFKLQDKPFKNPAYWAAFCAIGK